MKCTGQTPCQARAPARSPGLVLTPTHCETSAQGKPWLSVSPHKKNQMAMRGYVNNSQLLTWELSRGGCEKLKHERKAEGAHGQCLPDTRGPRDHVSKSKAC